MLSQPLQLVPKYDNTKAVYGDSKQQNYGCKRDVTDHRDMIRTYNAGEITSNTKHGLVKDIHRVYDKGGLGSSSSNILCSAYGLELMQQSMESNNITLTVFISSLTTTLDCTTRPMIKMIKMSEFLSVMSLRQ